MCEDGTPSLLQYLDIVVVSGWNILSALPFGHRRGSRHGTCSPPYHLDIIAGKRLGGCPLLSDSGTPPLLESWSNLTVQRLWTSSLLLGWDTVFNILDILAFLRLLQPTAQGLGHPSCSEYRTSISTPTLVGHPGHYD